MKPAEVFGLCYNQLPEATLLISAVGTIQHANRAAKQFLNFEGQLEGTRLQELVNDPPEKVARLLSLFGRSRDLFPGTLLLKGRQLSTRACRIEGAIFNANELEKWLLVRLFSKESTGREFLALNERHETLNRQLLERRKAGEKLHAQQEWLRATLGSIADAVIATDIHGKISFLNGIAENLTGWKQMEAVGMALSNIYDVGIEPPLQLTSKTGHQIPIEESAAPIRDAKGVIAGSVIVFRDVSARREAEAAMQRSIEALRKSELLYRGIGESINYGIWICTPDGRNVYASDSFLKLVGITQDQCSSFGWGELLHPNDIDQTIAGWNECVQTGGNWNIEHRFLGVDGKYHWVLARGVAVRDESGEVINWAGINLDIDQAKAVEENLRSSEWNLRKVNEASMRANEDLRQFAFAASHDLQEPLRMINSFSQLLIKAWREGREAEAVMSVGVIREGTERMRNLLTDLLSYTQLSEDGNQPLVKIDLNVTVHKVIENLRVAIEKSTARITVETLPVIEGQDAHFMQLFQNLIENAIKYQSSASPEIHVSAERLNDGWKIGVADNGMGIDLAHHQKIFGVFKRLHGKSIPGTGIGLALCQRVVERYGGQIWVESELNQGATFYCTIPATTGSTA